MIDSKYPYNTVSENQGVPPMAAVSLTRFPIPTRHAIYHKTILFDSLELSEYYILRGCLHMITLTIL